jgi:hypothetical protein
VGVAAAHSAALREIDQILHGPVPVFPLLTMEKIFDIQTGVRSGD